MTQKPYLCSNNGFNLMMILGCNLQHSKNSHGGGKMTEKPYPGSKNWLTLMIIGKCELEPSKH